VLRLKKITLNIEEPITANDGEDIRVALNALPLVMSVDVHFKDQSVIVYAGPKLDAGELTAAVRGAGFTAVPIEDPGIRK